MLNIQSSALVCPGTCERGSDLTNTDPPPQKKIHTGEPKCVQSSLFKTRRVPCNRSEKSGQARAAQFGKLRLLWTIKPCGGALIQNKFILYSLRFWRQQYSIYLHVCIHFHMLCTPESWDQTLDTPCFLNRAWLVIELDVENEQTSHQINALYA